GGGQAERQPIAMARRLAVDCRLQRRPLTAPHRAALATARWRLQPPCSTCMRNSWRQYLETTRPAARWLQCRPSHVQSLACSPAAQSRQDQTVPPLPHDPAETPSTPSPPPPPAPPRQ